MGDSIQCRKVKFIFWCQFLKLFHEYINRMSNSYTLIYLGEMLKVPLQCAFDFDFITKMLCLLLLLYKIYAPPKIWMDVATPQIVWWLKFIICHKYNVHIIVTSSQSKCFCQWKVFRKICLNAFMTSYPFTNRRVHRRKSAQTNKQSSSLFISLPQII